MSYDNIPDILKQQKQWVVWGVPGAPPKSPFRPDALLKFTAVPAKSGVPSTWGAYPDAVRCVSLGLARGTGYEFANDDIYGVDLDHVIGEGGELMPEAREIVERLGSYTEISPSGHGLHIFVAAGGINLTRHRRQGGFVEIYGSARYFTVTGAVFSGYDRINNRPAELQEIHDSYFQVTVDKGQLTVNQNFCVTNYSAETANSLRRGLAKDPVLRACWNGERRYGDESASDQALMNKLAYWCNADQAAMCAAFLQSPYFAGKDEIHKKKCARTDYLPNTATAACATLRSTADRDTAGYRRERELER